MAQQLITFKDIVDAISEDIGIQSTDTPARNKIKRFINMIYVDEVASFKRWDWLQKSSQIIHKEYFNVGKASVTPDSITVTLDTAPNVNLGSFKGYRFSVDGKNQIYTVASHTAASTTVTLTSEYKEELNATANFKIWRDRIDLPTGARETIEITHARRSSPLEAVGFQGFRKYEAAAGKQEGQPSVYHTGDYFDPSDSDGESESDRYRQTLIWPSISTQPITLNVDWIQEVVELEDDADEPLMPVSDRVVLYYGAGSMAWSTINRNEEMSDKRQMAYQQKLARMAGNREEGMDTPTLKPTSGYVNSIRRSGLKRKSLAMSGQAVGSSSAALPSYLKDVTIDGATVVDDITVSDGVLIDGRDLSEDGDVLDSLVTPQSVTLTDNTSSQVIATYDLATYGAVHIEYSIQRDTDYEAGKVTIITDTTNTSIAQGGMVEIGDVGVTLTADISGGNLRLLSTTTSTGSDATFKYREYKWLPS